MERPDLKGAYGGWQALDATPQPYNEQSKVFTIGPAPVAAVQQGKFVRYVVCLQGPIQSDLTYLYQNETLLVHVCTVYTVVPPLRNHSHNNHPFCKTSSAVHKCVCAPY